MLPSGTDSPMHRRPNERNPVTPSRRTPTVCVLALLSLAVATPAAGQTPSLSTLGAEIPALMAEAGIPGLTIGVIAGGRVVWTGAFGVADEATGQPVDERTVFQAASLTKQVFAYTALRLADRGVIELDTPLAEYLPYPRLEHEPRYRRITARQALSHSTGLPNWGGERLDLSFDPGTGFNYSGEGYVYLQRALEELTGEPLGTLVEREVLGPLGMEDTSIAWRPGFEGRAAARHDDWGRSQGVARSEEENAASSLLTTAGDYARFVAHLMSGDGLAESMWAEALEPQIQVASRPALETADRLYWGLGFGIQEGRGGRAIWQWGHNGGFRALLLAWPERGDGLVYFANGDAGLSVGYAIVDLVEKAAGWPESDDWALDWLGYERYDAPARVARRRIVEATISGGAHAGITRWEAIRTDLSDADAELLLARVGGDLIGLGRTDDAIAVYEHAVERDPRSFRAHRALGDALLEIGRYEDAYARYAEVLERVPGHPDAVRSRAWIEPVLAALASPVDVPRPLLERYAGDYGPRHITLDGGRLYYRRDDGEPVPLVPISEDTFVREGMGSFRIRFVRDEAGRPTKIIGLYADGSRDETPRDP